MHGVFHHLVAHHDFSLVLLAAGLCAVAALAVFQTYQQALRSSDFRRHVLLIVAAIANGAGIWATHFVAMLAYSPGVSTTYEPLTTAASLIVAIFASIVGLELSSRGIGWLPFAGGGVVGVGIALMHFVGMAALVVPGTVVWEPGLVVAAIAVGGVLSAIALNGYHQSTGKEALFKGSGLLMVAILVLHFTAMGAVTVVPDPGLVVPVQPLDRSGVAFAVTGAALLVILFATTSTAYVESHTRRLRERELQTLNEELEHGNAQLQAIIDNFPGGITLLDSDLRIAVINQQAKALLDLPEHLFCGRTVTFEDVVRFSAHRGEYGAGNVDKLVQARLALMKARRPHELEGSRTNGTIVEVRGLPVANGGFLTTYLDVTERRRSEARIVHMAHHDALTDLPNRALLRERLERALASTKCGYHAMAILMLDLDRFKEINDTLGHSVGDALLVAVGERLRSGLAQGMTIARLGGDEFAIVADFIDAPAQATALAETIHALLSRPFNLVDHQVVVGSSIGIAIGPGDGTDADQLLKNADLALYRAKADGRGVHRFFEPEMNRQILARRDMEQDLRNALVQGEFELHYQPFCNVELGVISGCEALLRWKHSRRGMVQPAEFVALAEETGLIVPIGAWVLRKACADAATWPDHLKIAVNLSPAQFKSPDIVPTIVNAIADAGIAPHRLEIEITESVMIQDSQIALSTLTQLRRLGVRIALDDFGTGYSSLSFLRDYPLDKIKIDRSFVRDMAANENGSRAIVRAIVQLAVGLGKTTTAEGVETKELLELAGAEGCTEAQGYYLSRPQPLAAIASLLRGESETMATAA